MQKFKNFIMKFGSSFAALALIIGISTSNSKRIRRGQIWLSPYFFINSIWSYIER